MNKPSNGQTISVGTAFPVELVFTNNGPSTINAGDSLYYTFNIPNAGVYAQVINTSKAPGDTIMFYRNFTFTTGTNGNATFCYVGLIVNGANPAVDPDTSNNDGCQPIVITGGTTGIAQNSGTEKNIRQMLTLWPNPSTSDVHIKYKAQTNGELKANITDVTGRKIMTISFGEHNKGKSEFKLNIESLNSGVYVIELVEEEYLSIGKIHKL